MSEHTNCVGTSDLEDMPMKRYTNPIPVCAEGPSSPCRCREELEAIQTLLTCQNQLLVDLLGAVNSLAAAVLARRA